MTNNKLGFGVGIVLCFALLIGLGSLLAVAFTTVPSDPVAKQTAPVKLLSSQQAEQIALAAVPGELEDTEIERKNGRLIFSVEILDGNKEHAVKVDAISGEILGTETESKVGTSDAAQITEKEAKDIASSKANGNVEEVELEKINGKLVYAVELKNGNTETEVRIDAKTGEVLDVKQEINQPQTTSSSGSLSDAKLEQIALSQVDGRVTDIEIERKRGQRLYVVEVVKNGIEHDVLIDMSTGEVIDVESD